MDSVQFRGYVSGASDKWGTGSVVVKLECKLKYILEADREKLGAWASMDDPKVDMVVTTGDDGPSTELEGDLTAARIDLAAHKLVVNIKIQRDDINDSDRLLLTALVRIPRIVDLEIKTAQMSLGIR